MPSKSIPISKTKIIVPNRRPELLSRPRLLESMKSLLGNKLLLLSAPAGYGKTSLLIDLAHTIDMPVCWLSIDTLDHDPQRFLAYLIASLAEQFPRIGEASRPQLNRLKSIEQDAESLLITLTNEIYDQIEEDDRISVLGLTDLAPDQDVTCRIHKSDGSVVEFTTSHTLSADQIGWFRAGSALNVIRRQLESKQD